MTQVFQEDHLHPSLITLSQDPFKNIPIQFHCNTRVVCAKLCAVEEGSDGFNRESVEEAEQLKLEASCKDLKRKDAYTNFCRRIYKDYKNSEYGTYDLSSLFHKKGTRNYYKEAIVRAQKNYHLVEPVRSKF